MLWIRSLAIAYEVSHGLTLGQEINGDSDDYWGGVNPDGDEAAPKLVVERRRILQPENEDIPRDDDSVEKEHDAAEEDGLGHVVKAAQDVRQRSETEADDLDGLWRHEVCQDGAADDGD